LIFNELKSSMNKKEIDSELKRLEENGDIYSTADGFSFAITE